MGGGIVVLTKEQYKLEIDKLLGDGNTCEVLNNNLTKKYKKELEKIIKYGVNTISI